MKAICTWLKSQSLSSFSEHTDLEKDTDVFFSVGGDGTLLRSLELIRDTEIPVIGVNTGRLGFLATLQADDIQIALQAFVDRQYRVENRTLLEVEKGCIGKPCRFPIGIKRSWSKSKKHNFNDYGSHQNQWGTTQFLLGRWVYCFYTYRVDGLFA